MIKIFKKQVGSKCVLSLEELEKLGIDPKKKKQVLSGNVYDALRKKDDKSSDTDNNIQ